MAWPDWDQPLSKQDVSPRELVSAMNEINALPAAALAGAPNKGPVALNPATLPGTTLALGKGADWYNVKAYSAKGDTQFVTDGAMASGSAVLTSASALFAAGDVTKLITVPKAGALITPPTSALTAVDGGAGATNLPTGNYTFVLTWVTGFGETTIGSSSLTNYNQSVANHIITLTIPALPASAGAWKLYCTAAGAGGFTGLVSAGGGTSYAYTTGLTVNNANAAPGANTASTTLVTTIASFQSAGQVTLTAANASGATVSSSFVNWGTDDTAAINACLLAASLVYGEAEIPPVPVGYMVSAAITLPVQNVQIRGGGVRSLYSGSRVSLSSVNMPTVAPYLAGSVIIQTATGQDGFVSTAIGPTLNIRDVGVRFTNWFAGTGHGFNLNPPPLSGKQDQGMYDSIWSGTKVFGHDGNHYAYNLINVLYNVYHGIRGYGGGFINLSQNGSVPIGNEVFNNPYGVVFVAGSAHGINETGITTGNAVIFTAWIRPQVWVQDPTADAQYTTLTAPTSAQFCLFTDANVRLQSWVVPDFETNVGSLARFPIGGPTGSPALTFIAPGLYTPDLITNTIQNNPVTGTGYQNMTGTGGMYTYSATLNPTGGAAATVLAEVAPKNLVYAQVAQLVAPATGLAGQVQSMCFYVPAGHFFRITLTNAAQEWTSFSVRNDRA